MNHFFSSTLFLLLTSISLSQTDTIYLDNEKKNCIRDSAKQYRIVINAGNIFTVKDYYLNNQPQMIAQCSSLDPFVKNGKCTFYEKNGSKKSRGYHLDNKKIGVWTWWYDNEKDSLAGEFKTDETFRVLSPGYYVPYRGKMQFVVKEGKGEPTVVFLSGLADPQNYFSHVYMEVKKRNQIIAYDRAGLGNSEFIDNERRVDTMAYELHCLLIKEEIKPPIVLVGHSMGGYIMRCFATMYPEETAGLMFIDPAIETQFKECLALRSEEDKKEYRTKYFSFLYSSDRNQGTNGETKYVFDNDSTGYSTNGKIVKDLKLPKNIPVTFIVSAQTNPEVPYSKQDSEFRLTYFRNLKKEMPQIKLVETSKSGHYIHDAEPGLVIEEIFEILNKIKTNSR